MPKKEKPVVIPDRSTVEKMVAEYAALRHEEKRIKDRKAFLSDAIKSYSLSNGVKDENGSFYSDCDNYTYGAQCKKSVKFDDEKAALFFQSKGFEDCVKLVPQIVQSAVLGSQNCQRILIISFYVRQQSYRLQIPCGTPARQTMQLPSPSVNKTNHGFDLGLL